MTNFPKCDVCGTTKKQLFLLNSFFCPRDCDRKVTGQERTFWGAFSASIEVKREITCYLFDSVQQVVEFLRRHEKNFPPTNKKFFARRVRLVRDALVYQTNYYGEKVDTGTVEIIDEMHPVEISI